MQPRGEKEQLKRTKFSLPSSAQDAANWIQADKYCPSYQRVMEDQKARAADIEKKRAETESIVSVPLRQETPPTRTAKPVLKKLVPVPMESKPLVLLKQEASPMHTALPVPKMPVSKPQSDVDILCHRRKRSG